MFSTYKAEVVRTYYQKKEVGDIPLNLLEPTPAKLKRECLAVFNIRRTKADLEVLRQFFGHCEDEVAYERAIRKIDTDKFRPLTKFLRREIENPDDRNIFLLAWLIDFYPRPFKPGWQSKKNDTSSEKNDPYEESYSTPVEAGIEKPEELKLLEDPHLIKGRGIGLPLAERNYLDKYKKHGFIGLALLMIGAIGLSLNNTVKTSIHSLLSNPQCMYWAEDHYVSVECDQQIPNIDVFPLVAFKLQHFKKITRRDTLTERDINKVWYASVNKQIEFYTTEGNDPREPRRQLRPMSKYIYEKYIKPLNTKPKQ